MSVELVREQLIETIQTLGEEQVKALLSVARLMQPSAGQGKAYDKDADVLRQGLFEGPADLAENIEEM